MRKFFFFISICTISLNAEIIEVHPQLLNIQAAIDSSANGDTVVVYPGVYQIEGISFKGKQILVTSLYFLDQDTAYITETVIDGKGISTIITFESQEDTSSILSGFKLVNATRHSIKCDSSSPKLSHLIISDNNDLIAKGILCFNESQPKILNTKIVSNLGYGIFCSESSPYIKDTIIKGNTAFTGAGIFCGWDSSPILQNVIITDNTAISDYDYDGGGGIFCGWDSYPKFFNVTISNNRANKGGGINCGWQSNIIFSEEQPSRIYNNHAQVGADLYGWNNFIIDVIVDTFTVAAPTSYYAHPLQKFTFSIQHGLKNLVNANLYVSPIGDSLNSGLYPGSPLKTVNHALSIIYKDSLSDNKVFLASGTYSTNTNGERFPLNGFVSLIGDSLQKPVLDAQDQTEHISTSAISDVSYRNLNLINGGASSMIIEASNVEISNLRISHSRNGRYGGGIYIDDSSNVKISDSEIRECFAGYRGGAIYSYASNLELNRVRLRLASH